MKEEKKTDKTKIMHVVFVRENGVQVQHPNGKFLRAVQDSKAKGLNSANDSDFHVLGIEQVTASAVGLVFYFKNGIQRHFPWAQISSFTTESIQE